MSLSKFKEKGLNPTSRWENSQKLAATLQTAVDWKAAVGVLEEPPERGPAARGLVRWAQATPRGPRRPGTWLGLYFQTSGKPVEGSRRPWHDGWP